ncbi:sugar transferase [Dyadobacter frigoris]|uniref:Sugar transferase n=1 Tax=Dyadobacter frigoris TaxID=2576211 RepID=A0A4U6D1U7_9BACT|nr:sugar transferase [Dyadobacter frigoris]TKT90596.1 sugar transferase [Dyadobacter frigoris]GLU51255.1 hypothetical protein Dfri01_07160 [Dyadobacter frigoris]
MENETYDDVVALELPAHVVRKSVSEKRIKRIFDFIFSLVLVVLIFPWLFPLVALLIVLNSKGGVLFIQKRTGLRNKAFNCIKFRTMYINDQSDTVAARENDSRITSIGKWLRIYGIDELPQLFNVLLGDMSIVGPRPHMHSDNVKFEQIVKNYQRRNQIRPGITGLAQVKGYKGDFTDSQEIEMRVALDLIYTDTYSFILDLKIIIRTIKVTFFRGNQNKRIGTRVDQTLPCTAQV